MKNKAQELHQDIIHNVKITGDKTFSDTRSLAFFDADGRPIPVLAYEITDDQSRVFVGGASSYKISELF